MDDTNHCATCHKNVAQRGDALHRTLRQNQLLLFDFGSSATMEGTIFELDCVRARFKIKRGASWAIGYRLARVFGKDRPGYFQVRV